MTVEKQSQSALRWMSYCWSNATCVIKTMTLTTSQFLGFNLTFFFFFFFGPRSVNDYKKIVYTVF